MFLFDNMFQGRIQDFLHEEFQPALKFQPALRAEILLRLHGEFQPGFKHNFSNAVI